MARINIETSIYLQHEFQDLMIKVGDRQKAKGMIVELWSLAQQYWFPDKKRIPLVEIEKAGLMATIEVGLADLNDEGVYAHGTEEAFDWLFQKQSAGKKSAGNKKTKKSTSVEHSSTDVERPSTSLLSSLSSFLINTKNKESIEQSAHALAPAIGNQISVEGKKQLAREKAGQFIAAYVKAYQTRWPDQRPEDLNDPKIRGQILNWAGSYGDMDRACELIQVYFQMDTKWFGTKGYDFLTFRNNLNRIGQALDSGQDPDGNQINWEKLRERAGV